MSEQDQDRDQMNANSEVIQPNTDVLIVRADSGRARHWHVGLQRLDRRDQNAPLVVGGAAGNQKSVESESYSFAAGFQTTPAYPPARSNPIGLSFDVDVLINWGFGAAQPARLAAQWPRLGSSLTVVGNFVEVYARWRSNPPVDANARPVATAWIAPTTGEAPRLEGGGLSLSQAYLATNPLVAGRQFGALYVPDFARSVRITPTLPSVTGSGPTMAPMFQGGIEMVGVFVDDLGSGCDSWGQGNDTFDPIVGPYAETAIQWHPVPSRATMLAIIHPTGFNSGYAHWRIAP